MTSRERVWAALNHTQPDRCPVDFWTEGTTTRTLLAHFGVKREQELYDIFETDLQFVFPDSTLPPVKTLPDGSWIDHNGAHMRLVKNDFCEYAEYLSRPLGEVENLSDLASYDKWPDASAFDWAGFPEKIGSLHEKRIIKLHAGGLYEMAWNLRGQEQFLMDMIAAPELAHAIMDKLCSYWCDYVERAMAVAGDKIDLVYTYDDIATQSTLIMSPQMLEEFVYPYHRRLNAVIKRHGKKILYHSCGAVTRQIDALAELPIDILNPLQPRATGMDFEVIKRTWGDKLCFHGGIDIQETLPHGSPEEVQAAVKNAISILGRNGGYIMTSAHYIQNDTPVENIIAMYDPSIRQTR
ncbi:MAG: hypothetical protein IJB51_11625 [Clostridia bacterium]|nr:hypothetical protein [Clostridia bacterium]